MNITFLIGNGFDINLGLDTRYTDFLEEYLKDDPRDNDEIKAFKEDIRKQEAKSIHGAERLWSNAEMAFGEYTDDIVKQGKTAASFSIRRIDFCTKLAKYLQDQEGRIIVEGREQAFVDAIQRFRSGLLEATNEAVGRASDAFDGGYVFNFIVFNYTEIIDQFIDAVKKRKLVPGTRSHKGTAKQNSFGKIMHVHGTTTKDMIFGVNDESQIANMELFNGQSPFYLNSFIKQKTNNSNESRIDEKTYEIIKSSSFIYIYGMSMGNTDKIWWQRIIERMKAQGNTHVFLYCFDAPKDTLIREGRWFYDDEKKDQFLAFVDGDNTALKSRIHIMDTDIFAAFANIAVKPEEISPETEPVPALPLTS